MNQGRSNRARTLDRSRLNLAGAAAAVISTLAFASLAQAQGSAVDPVDVPLVDVAGTGAGDEKSAKGKNWEIALLGGYTHQFRADLDDGGDYSVSRFVAGIGFGLKLNDRLDLNLGFGYEFNGYDFEGDTVFGFAADDDIPWRSINLFNVGASLNYRLDDHWRVFGGPIVRFAGESDADAGDSITGGGFAGAAYRFSDKLTLGGGFGVITQIEDDTTYFPVLIVNWQITDNLRLANAGASAGITVSGRASGFELVWSFLENAELALGADYALRRFRLDDGNAVAPEGVGEESNFPIWLRASYKFNPTFSVDAYLGVALGGEIKLDDRNGDRIAKQDVDPAPTVGVSLRLRF